MKFFCMNVVQVFSQQSLPPPLVHFMTKLKAHTLDYFHRIWAVRQRVKVQSSKGRINLRHRILLLQPDSLHDRRQGPSPRQAPPDQVTLFSPPPREEAPSPSYLYPKHRRPRKVGRSVGRGPHPGPRHVLLRTLRRLLQTPLA